ncbi:MAG: hypothetical protein KatS3mg121_0058 [Gammaproteobacteria bacterium]|nr:MAG: hypothetical protein KatS3mg121_0058 [Gammaproteobacteria bacterium]
MRTLFCLLLSLTASLAAAVDEGALQSLRGASMDAVRTRFGTPVDTRGPVGDPPITRWLYPDFTVVFEYDRVVHAFPRRPEIEAQPPVERGGGDTLDLPDRS